MNNNSRTYNSLGNLTMSFVQRIVTILLTFVGRQIFLRVLTVEYLGINGLFADVLNMLTLADLGLTTAMAYSFYKPLAEKDEDKLAALIGFYRKVYNIIAVSVSVVGLALTPFLHYIINLEMEILYIEIYYLIALANTVISYLFVYKASIITADQKSRIITKYAVWLSMARIALQIIALLVTGSFMIFSLVTIFTTLANNLLISWKAIRLYPFIKRRVKLEGADKQDVFKNIKSVFIYKIADVIYKGTDNIFISVLIGTAVVGKYANYHLAVSNLSMIALMIFNSLAPSIGNLVAQESPEKRLQIFKVMQTASYWLSGFFVFCLFFLLDEFVILWLEREFVFDLFTKVAILLSLYTSMTLYPIVAFRSATGMYQKTKHVLLIAAVLKIILSIILGVNLGLPGIILATVISRMLTYAWYEPKILFRDFFDSSAAHYLYRNILNFLLLIGCIAAAHFLFPWQEVSGWLEWLLKGVAYTLAINAVYLLIYFRTPQFRFIADKIKEVLKNTLRKNFS